MYNLVGYPKFRNTNFAFLLLETKILSFSVITPRVFTLEEVQLDQNLNLI
jgi:hypothetical protein